ncbi:hypothetical protein GCM10027072_16830 [Streptomyces bullii]
MGRAWKGVEGERAVPPSWAGRARPRCVIRSRRSLTCAGAAPGVVVGAEPGPARGSGARRDGSASQEAATAVTYRGPAVRVAYGRAPRGYFSLATCASITAAGISAALPEPSAAKFTV